MRNIILQNLDENPNGEYVVEQDISLTVVVYASGKKSVDGKTHVRLVGSGAEACIYGVFIADDGQKITLHTLQHHEAQGTTSNLLIKSVLNHLSAFSYNGEIRVEKEGQKTDAYQRNENLLLTPSAFAQSKPSLEILADDVRCTHGATIGSVDRDQLYYLKTRGISEQYGIKLIVEGFIESVLEKIPDRMKAEVVRNTLWQNM